MSARFHTGGGAWGFTCPWPECGGWIDIEWTGDYGDPEVGVHDGKCPRCDKRVGIEVSVNIAPYKR